MGRHIVRDIVNKRIDPETGDILEYTERKEVVKAEEEPFFLTYSRQILALFDSNILNSTTKVLYKLMEFSEYNTGIVYMNGTRINEILETCKISKTSYYRAIEDLKKKGIISGNKDTYTINESIFWKGDRKTRDNMIRSKCIVSFTPVFDNNVELVS